MCWKSAWWGLKCLTVNCITCNLPLVKIHKSYGRKNTNRGILIKIVISLSKVNCLQTIATDYGAQWWLQLVNKETPLHD